MGEKRERSTVLLLGAGASRDAGLPLMADLARTVVEDLNREPEEPPWLRALNFVYGQMVGHQSERGENPLNAVSIERLISALRLLQNKDDHEAAPFVASWKPGAAGFQQTGTLGALAHGDLEAHDSLVEAEQQVIDALVAALDQPLSVDYLEPIAQLAREQQNGLNVITLNYDRTVEQMSAESGIACTSVLSAWWPGHPIDLPTLTGHINLIKLHGSLDWTPAHRSSLVDPFEVVVEPSPRWGISSQKAVRPWIVVGDRDKLGSGGPILALMRAAEEALARANHLVVVGYSFRDPHVNRMIGDWMAAEESRTIGILDPSWSEPDDLKRALRVRYGGYRDRGLDGLGKRLREPRLVAVEGTTAQSLQEVLTASPPRLGQASVDGKIRPLGDSLFEITLTLAGVSLQDVWVMASEVGNPSNRLLDLGMTPGPARRSSWKDGDSASWNVELSGVQEVTVTVWGNLREAPQEVGFETLLTRDEA